MSQDMFGGELPKDFFQKVGDPDLRHAWPQALVSMVDVACAALVREGQTPETARALAETMMTSLADYFGGRQWYLPRGDSLKHALRDQRIWADFTGDNVRVLADKYDLTEVRIYEILREQRVLHRKKVQGELF